MRKSGRFLLSLCLILLCTGSFLALFVFTASPVGAFHFAESEPTQENLWAHVDLPKPTYTATATSLPTDFPTQAATETPPPLSMEIIDEISAALNNAPVPETQPSPPPGTSKYILVDISDQHMFVYENGALIYSFVVSTGIHNATRVGAFAVDRKSVV